MKNPIENIRLSQEAKERLIILKRTIHMVQWNELCRWAFCISLADSKPPSDRKIITDSTVEMTWKTFGGSQHEIYFALLCIRCQQDRLELDDEILKNQFRLHLHRGIANMVGNPKLRTIENILELATKQHSHSITKYTDKSGINL
jgi:DNA sulfur modification protein DndE